MKSKASRAGCLRESCPAAGPAPLGAFLRAQKWGCFSPADPAEGCRDLASLYSKKEIKTLFLIVGPWADRMCHFRCQTFTLLSDAEILENNE